MSKIKVNVEREDVKATIKTRYSAESVVPGILWKMRYTQKQFEDLRAMVTNRIHKRIKWKHLLYSSIWTKMDAKVLKAQQFEVRSFKDTDQVIQAFYETISVQMELHKIKPVQKSIDEVTNPKKTSKKIVRKK